jgi:signal transduction histidine kinase
MNSTDTGTKTEQIPVPQLGRQVAHDLNNPIGAISTSIYLIQDFIDTAKDGHIAVDELKPFVDSIREECDTLKGIVEEFAKYATLDGLLLMPMDLHEFLSKRVEEAARGKLPVTFHGAPEPLMIEADASNLQYALLTLIDFAIASSATSVTITLTRNDDYCISVSDNRPRKLLPEYTDDVFGIGPSKNGVRMGLRLPLARKIIQLHGGMIRIADSGGDATQIEIVLPRAKNV